MGSLGISQLGLLETCLHAFELLGRLSRTGLPFLFKGGTSLLLHTETLRRISTDIDIVTPVRGDELEEVLRELAAGEPFVSFDEHERGLRGLPNRRHFRYYYRPVSDPSRPIPVLLDVVEDDFDSFEIEGRVIALPWFKPTQEAEVLRDTFQACLAITMVNFGKRIHADSATIWRGISNLANHVAGGTLGHQQVFEMAGKVAYLTAVLGSLSPAGQTKPVPPANLTSLRGLKIEGELRFLNPIGGASPLGLFYWSEAAKLAPQAWLKT